MPDEHPRDPDVDLHFPAQRRELRRAPWRILGAIAAGGTLGALARYGIVLLLPSAPGAFPLAVFSINVTGCLLIGVLMVVITELRTPSELVRPFLGVGVLGGFTTFSTYALDVRRALDAGAWGTALLVLLATPLSALAAVWLGTALTRALARRRGPAR